MHRTFLVGAPIAVAFVVLSLGYVFAQTNEEDSPCITGGAVYEWDLGTGLVADCEALLAARDTLRGTASLNWSADRFIERWDGIDVGRQSRRVETIKLHRQGLNGSIPSEIGNLDHLVELKLYANDLTGPLPAELGNLTSLEVLQVRNNQLSGQIPETLNNLSNLKNLALRGNSFTGCVSGQPAECPYQRRFAPWPSHMHGHCLYSHAACGYAHGDICTPAGRDSPAHAAHGDARNADADSGSDSAHSTRVPERDGQTGAPGRRQDFT